MDFIHQVLYSGLSFFASETQMLFKEAGTVVWQQFFGR